MASTRSTKLPSTSMWLSAQPHTTYCTYYCPYKTGTYTVANHLRTSCVTKGYHVCSTHPPQRVLVAPHGLPFVVLTAASGEAGGERKGRGWVSAAITLFEHPSFKSPTDGERPWWCASTRGMSFGALALHTPRSECRKCPIVSTAKEPKPLRPWRAFRQRCTILCTFQTILLAGPRSRGQVNVNIPNYFSNYTNQCFNHYTFFSEISSFLPEGADGLSGPSGVYSGLLLRTLYRSRACIYI